MTERGNRWLADGLCLCGSLLLVLGTLLPLWSKNGVQVSGWEGSYLAWGRWLLVAAALGGICASLVPALRKRGFLRATSGLVALLQAALILWQGYKLQAIGLGAWVVLGGALLVLASWGMRRWM